MRQSPLPEAWQHTRGETSTVIAIVDTGVDPNQPDLRGRFVKGWDFHNDDANPYDDDGHGTAVATTAAAAGNDRVGIAGACWRCKIMPVKVLNGNGHGTQSNLAAGIVWADQSRRGRDQHEHRRHELDHAAARRRLLRDQQGRRRGGRGRQRRHSPAIVSRPPIPA